MNYDTAKEIEIAVARWFGINKYVIVPNVGWGMFSDRELDLMLLNRSGYAYEVEIKVSHSDLIKDKDKRHSHFSPRLKRLYFAIPEKIRKNINEIPENAGILVVNRFGIVNLIKQPKENRSARKLSLYEQYKLARLGAMRIWKLKSKLVLNEW